MCHVVAAEVAPDVTFSMRAAWGRSDNSARIDVFDTGNAYRGDFSTERTVIVSTLQGSYRQSSYIINPLAEFIYLREEQASFTVSDGSNNVSVPGVSSVLGRLVAGAEIVLPADTWADMPLIYSRPKIDWNFRRDGYGDALETFTGSVELGIRTDERSPWLGELAVRYDGLGDSGFNAVSLRATFSMEF